MCVFVYWSKVCHAMCEIDISVFVFAHLPILIMATKINVISEFPQLPYILILEGPYFFFSLANFLRSEM